MPVAGIPPEHLIDDEVGRDCPRCPRLVAVRHALREKQPAWHNAPVPSFGPVTARFLIDGLTLFDSYHCSRYNTNTGVLTPDMFGEVFAAVRRYLDDR